MNKFVVFFEIKILIIFINMPYIFSSFIVLPFNTYQNHQEDSNKELNISLFFENYYSNIIYTQIEIGSPKKLVPTIITSNSHGLLVGYLCNNIFDMKESLYDNKSTTFYRESNEIIIYPQYNGGYFAKDSFTFSMDFETNSNNKITINNISFICIPKESSINIINKKYKNNNVCGIMGLSLKYVNYCEEQRNIITNLNKLDIIHNYAYSIYYKNNNEGFIIIGEEPHNAIPNIFNENNLRKVNALSEGYDSMEWKTEFTQIYIYDNEMKIKITDTKMAKFAIEINYIVGTNNYRKIIEKYFFEKYLDQNICYYEKIKKQRYSVLICNNEPNFDVNSFPSIFFFHKIFNYTFEFSKDDLFLKKNNKYIFLVFFSDYDIKYFVLGKIFLKNNLLIFNQDTKTIGFYNPLLEEKKIIDNNNLILKIIGIMMIIICCLIGFYLSKKIYEQTRKRRINEINEQYEYNSFEKNDINYENNNKNNNKNNIILEMPSKN